MKEFAIQFELDKTNTLRGHFGKSFLLKLDQVDAVVNVYVYEQNEFGILQSTRLWNQRFDFNPKTQLLEVLTDKECRIKVMVYSLKYERDFKLSKLLDIEF